MHTADSGGRTEQDVGHRAVDESAAAATIATPCVRAPRHSGGVRHGRAAGPGVDTRGGQVSLVGQRATEAPALFAQSRAAALTYQAY